MNIFNLLNVPNRKAVKITRKYKLLIIFLTFFNHIKMYEVACI